MLVLIFGKIDVCRYKVFQKIDGEFVEIYDTGSSDEDFFDGGSYKVTGLRSCTSYTFSVRISGLKPGRKYKVRVKTFGRIPKGRKQYVTARGGHTKVLWGKASKAVVVRTKK